MNAIDKPAAAEAAPVPAVVEPNGAASILQIITSAARDPTVNVDKIERLTALYRQMRADEAKAIFVEQLMAVQSAIPPIEKRGLITIHEKGKPRTDANLIQSTPYALWDDINEIIKPILRDHDFTLSFRTGIATDGKITVTGVLSHTAGHEEQTTITLPHDSSGSKNAVQAVGSSTSYGKRYVASALLNLTFLDEDDDAEAGGTAHLTAEQITELQSLIVNAGADLPRFLKFMKVERLDDIPADQFAAAKHAIEQKARAGKK